MVISEADRVKPIIKKNNFLENTFLVRAIHMKYSIYIVMTFGVDRMLETRMIIIKPSQQSEDEDIFFLKTLLSSISVKIDYY